MSLPIVALVGRPNVGKSTLFNKIAGGRIAIVEDIPGITRDRIYSEANFNNKRFNVIDTGGIDVAKEIFNDEIRVQAEIAIEEADVVVFVVDGKEGLTSNDFAIRDLLRVNKKRVIVAINKIDTKVANENLYDFYELGFEEYYPVSGEHNIGFTDLLLAITKDFKEFEEVVDTRTRFSVIGRPNVGKSSLINAILNEERVIVSNTPGTTRDAIDTPFTYNKEEFVAIDTAGMRKRGKVYESVEKYSLLRSLKAIDRSDMALLVIDASQGIVEQDKAIAGYAIERGKGIIIVVNKWDTIDTEETSIKEYTNLIRNEFAFITYAPIVFTSALTKKRIHTLMPEILKVSNNINRQVKTSLLNDIIMDIYTLNPPPSYKGRRLKIYYANQAGTKPPRFIFHVNNRTLVHFSYERHLENKLRENFDFEGTPIEITFKNRGGSNDI